MPGFQGRVHQPFVPFAPFGPVGGVVQRDKRVDVGMVVEHAAGVVTRGRDRIEPFLERIAFREAILGARQQERIQLEPGDFGRQRAAEVGVAGEIEVGQGGHVLYPRRQRSPQVVLREVQTGYQPVFIRSHPVPGADVPGTRPALALRPVPAIRLVIDFPQGRPVVPQVHAVCDAAVGQSPEPGLKLVVIRRAQLRSVEQEFIQVRLIPGGKVHFTCQTDIAIEPHTDKFSKIGNRTNIARQHVIGQIDALQVGQQSELEGDFARQPVVLEVDRNHPVVRIRFNAEPFAQRLVAQPVRVVRPVRAAGLQVEYDQWILVRAARRIGGGAVVDSGIEPEKPRLERGIVRCAQTRPVQIE